MRRLKAPERRKQLIEVATQLFAERGFESTTTAAIAAAAGVSEPILYRHFRSKQELFIAIVTEVTKGLQEGWGQLLQHAEDPATALRVISEQWPKHLAACPEPHKVISCAMVTSKDPEVICVLKAHYAQMEAFFTALITKGQEQGVFRKMDPKLAVWWMMHYGVGYTIFQTSIGGPENYDFLGGIELTMRALRAD